MRDPYEELGAQYDAILTGPSRSHTDALCGLVMKLTARRYFATGWLVNVTDLCCGTGLIADRFKRMGYLAEPALWWHVTGVDRSAEMLRIAKSRLDDVILTDATATGLPTASSDLTLNTYAWTDVSDWAALVREAERITVPGGHFVAAGAHPSFIGPHVNDAEQPWTLHAGYYRHGPAPEDAPGNGSFRRLVGWHHLTLPALLGPVLSGRWHLEAVAEGGGDPPVLFGFRARRLTNNTEGKAQHA